MRGSGTPSGRGRTRLLFPCSDHLFLDRRKVVLDHSVQALTAARQATFEARDRWLEEQARNPLDRLAELMDLRDRGVLTDAEYEAQKRRLLGQ